MGWFEGWLYLYLLWIWFDLMLWVCCNNLFWCDLKYWLKFLRFLEWKNFCLKFECFFVLDFWFCYKWFVILFFIFFLVGMGVGLCCMCFRFLVGGWGCFGVFFGFFNIFYIIFFGVIFFIFFILFGVFNRRCFSWFFREFVRCLFWY